MTATTMYSICLLHAFLINVHIQKIIGYLQSFSTVSHKCDIAGNPKYINNKTGMILPIFDVVIYHHLDNCAAVVGHGTNDMNGYGSPNMGCSHILGCSHIATDLGSHRAQTNMGFVYRCRFIIMHI